MSETNNEARVSPADYLRQLPSLTPEAFTISEDDGLRRAELRHSLCAIAQLTHLSETALVRGFVEKLLGRLPAPTE